MNITLLLLALITRDAVLRMLRQLACSVIAAANPIPKTQHSQSEVKYPCEGDGRINSVTGVTEITRVNDLLASRKRDKRCQYSGGTIAEVDNPLPENIPSYSKHESEHPDDEIDRIVQHNEDDFEQEQESPAEAENDTEHVADDEEVLKLRQGAWICFTPQEDIDDHTEGPCRFVSAFDGVRECVALLTTYDLSQKIQKMLMNQRKVTKFEDLAERQTDEAWRFRFAVQREIDSHKARISTAKEENKNAQTIEDDKQQLRVLQRILAAIESEQPDLESRRATGKEILLNSVAAVNAYMEEAFIDARLLQPEVEVPEEVVVQRDLEVEYEKMCKEMYGTGDESLVTKPLNTSRDYLYCEPAPRTPEEEARDNLVNRVYDAKKRFERAQYVFHTKEDKREHEAVELNKAAKRRGSPIADASVEDFDRRWVVRFQEITHELVVAEDDYRQIKIEAAEAGIVDLEDGRSSCFIDDDDDDSRFSVDKQEVKEAKEDPRIGNWMNDISNVGDYGSDDETHDIDDWEAAEVEICDSISAVEIGTLRRRIDKWQQLRQVQSEP